MLALWIRDITWAYHGRGICSRSIHSSRIALGVHRLEEIESRTHEVTDASIIGVRVGLRWYVGLGMGGLYHFEVWSAMVNIETVTADNSRQSISPGASILGEKGGGGRKVGSSTRRSWNLRYFIVRCDCQPNSLSTTMSTVQTSLGATSFRI